MIEFKDKDKYCRWNGTLMSPENHKKLFGIDKELVCLTKDLIIYDTTYYTDMPLDKLLLKIGTHYKTDAQRKEVCSMDAGWHDSIWEHCLKDKVVVPYSAIKGMKVKPIYEFRNDFPYFDNKAYTKFYKELDEYYNNMAFEPTDRTENMDYNKPIPKPVIYIESESGILIPKGEKIFLSRYKYERGAVYYGWSSGAYLEMSATDEDKEKLYNAFIRWSNKWNGRYTPKAEYSDTLILTDERVGRTTFFCAIPRECNYEENSFVADADWME